MVNKARSHVYGKRRCNDLVTALDNLNISPAIPTPPRKASIAGNGRTPLKPVSHNLCLSTSSSEIEDLGEGQSLTNQDTSLSIKVSPEEKDQTEPRNANAGPVRRGRKPKAKKAAFGVGGKDSANALKQKETQIESRKAETLKTEGEEFAGPSRSRKWPGSLYRDPSGRPSPPTSTIAPPELTALFSLPYITSPAPLSFSAQYSQWATNLSITKIAQGSYASILRLALPEEPSTYTIWKLMPLKPRHGKGSRTEGATLIDDAIAECRLLEAMSKTPGFVEFRSALVLQGSIPKELREVERTWSQEQMKQYELSGKQEAPCEEEEREYGPDQVWLFVEMSDAGEDVENWLKRDPSSFDVKELWDVFWATVEAAAQGEAETGFEHRDLHLGNICVKRRKSHNKRWSYHDASGIGEEAVDSFITGNPSDSLVRKFTDLEVTLIDYTLSRASIDKPTSLNANAGLAKTPPSPSSLSEPENTNHEIFANSMRDPTLFTQDSDDPLDQLQYDTYRHMRDIMLHYHCTRKPHSDSARRGRKPKAGTEDQWKSFMPATNLVWLHHVLVMLLAKCGLGDDVRLKKERGAKRGKELGKEGNVILDRLKEVKAALWTGVEVAMGQIEVAEGDEEVWESAVNVLESEILRQGNMA